MNAVTPIRKSALSYLDWKVVEMARADGPRSLNPDGFLARVRRDLFGLPVATRLANDSLEALRRFSVRAWYWDLIRTTDVQALFDAGYTRTHALEILAHVAPFRGFSPTIQDDLPLPVRGWRAGCPLPPLSSPVPALPALSAPSRRGQSLRF